jgi:hypothetical protein
MAKLWIATILKASRRVPSTMPKRGAEPASAESFDNAAILAIVRDIAASAVPVKERARIFSRRYPDFAETFPNLFEMATNPDMDIGRLVYMLEMRAKVASSKMNVENATAKVKEAMYDVYIKDIMEKLPEPPEGEKK